MPEQRLDQIEEVYHEARRRPPEQREAYLNDACGDDSELRSEVESLLKYADEEIGEDDLTGDAAGSSGALQMNGAQSASSMRIGPYKLMEQIGEGGFGAVYMAEQREPVIRRVALKVIKLGMDTRQVIARFEAERQALAMMDHPNIARVLDAGSTSEGRPYFVMEYVRGEPITAYCDRNSLPVRERLELFAEVCHAVQHAHQKGIIHRDIKPSNVLVTIIDGRPVPKVIDFGIAKATCGGKRLTDKTLFTEHCQMIGTPQYMSPEQAEMSGVDIDTRSDVYSLGVVLYELLTGAQPFDLSRGPSILELQRMIAEVDPPRPSARASADGELTHRLRGELDWIVMKCLEKDPERRYPTAEQLAADVRRHLNDEPVLAGPPSATYRMRKFVRRHRFGVAAASITVVAMLSATAMSMTFAIAVTEQRQEVQEHAERAEREMERALAAEAEAKRQAEALERIVDFHLARLVDVNALRFGQDMKAAIIADRRAKLEGMGVSEAVVERDVAQLEDALAETWFPSVARVVLEENVYNRLIRAVESQFAEEPQIRADMLASISTVMARSGMKRAVTLNQEVLAIRQEHLGIDHPQTLEAMRTLGSLLQNRRPVEAEQLFRDALKFHLAHFGDNHVATFEVKQGLGLALMNLRRPADAEAFFRRAYEGRLRLLGLDNNSTLLSLNNLGVVVSQQRRFDEAEQIYRKVLEGRRRVMGDEHSSTVMTLKHIGVLLRNRGALDEAEPYLREAMETHRRVRGDSYPEVAIILGMLAEMYKSQGRVDQAEQYAREAFEINRRARGLDHVYTRVSTSRLARILVAREELEEAEHFFLDALDRSRKINGEYDSRTLSLIDQVGSLFERQDRLLEAARYRCEQLAGYRRLHGDEHQRALTALQQVAELLHRVMTFDDGLEQAATIINTARDFLPADHWYVAMLLRELAQLHWAYGRFAEAESAFLKAHANLNDGLGPHHERTVQVRQSLAGLYDAWSKAEPEAGHDGRAAHWRLVPADRDAASEAASPSP